MKLPKNLDTMHSQNPIDSTSFNQGCIVKYFKEDLIFYHFI